MSTGEQEYDFLFKLLLIGNINVGKSSLLSRFVKNVWNDSFFSTIGVEFNSKTLEVNGKKVKLQIWDTSGQNRFENIRAYYYRGANGILVVYDITERESFDNLTSWLNEIEKNVNKNVYKLLIGNKCDLEDKRENKREVTYQEGKYLAESNGMKFIETSAKDNTNVQEAFELLTSEIMKSFINKEKGMEKKDNTKQIHLSNNTEDISGKKKGEIIKKLEIENKKLKDDLLKANAELEKIKMEKNKLNDELIRSNKIISTMNNNNDIKKLKDDINALKYRLSVKDQEINELKIKSNIIDKPKYNIDDIIVITFQATDSSVNYGIKCVKTETFAEVEEKLYKKFNNLRNTNNMFTANAKPILRFKTIMENNIKDGDIIQLIKIE